MCTAIVSPDGTVIAGPLGEGEDMAVAEIDCAAITAGKAAFDSVGHYARPDILRLALDRRTQLAVEAIAPSLDECPAAGRLEELGGKPVGIRNSRPSG